MPGGPLIIYIGQSSLQDYEVCLIGFPGGDETVAKVEICPRSWHDSVAQNNFATVSESPGYFLSSLRDEEIGKQS